MATPGRTPPLHTHIHTHSSVLFPVYTVETSTVSVVSLELGVKIKILLSFAGKEDGKRKSGEGGPAEYLWSREGESR